MLYWFMVANIVFDAIATGVCIHKGSYGTAGYMFCLFLWALVMYHTEITRDYR